MTAFAGTDRKAKILKDGDEIIVRNISGILADFL
jgi:hypothetical protein